MAKLRRAKPSPPGPNCGPGLSRTPGSVQEETDWVTAKGQRPEVQPGEVGGLRRVERHAG